MKGVKRHMKFILVFFCVKKNLLRVFSDCLLKAMVHTNLDAVEKNSRKYFVKNGKKLTAVTLKTETSFGFFLRIDLTAT